MLSQRVTVRPDPERKRGELSMKKSLWICMWLGLSLVVGCTKAEEKPVAEKPAEAAKVAEKAPEKPRPTCVGAVTEGTATTVTTNSGTWELNGSTLKWTGAGEKAALSVGLLSDIKEGAAENLANIDKFVAMFKERKVDLVLVTGDVGMNETDVSTVLTKLADVKVPVVSIMGNREGIAFYNAGHKTANAAAAHVLDGNKIRKIDTDFVDVITLPGYHDVNYLHSEDGCAYTDADVAAVKDLATKSDSPVVLMAHGGPLQMGEQAIDLSSQGKHAGDPKLSTLIKDASIKFGFFGNIHEAGGKATNLEGTEVVKAGEFHPSFFLNPGPADAMEWAMNDGSVSKGMGALVEFTKDGTGKFEVVKF